MKANKKLLIPIGVLVVTAFGAAIIFANRALAANTTNQTLSERLAEKLNLDRSKVDSAFDSIEAENFAARQDQEKTKLDQAVKDGVITADQEQKILDKQKELFDQREKERKELEQWLSDNDLDLEKLREYGVGIGMIGFGGKGHIVHEMKGMGGGPMMTEMMP